MSAPNLKTHEWKLRYSRETGDPLNDFYIPALSCSISYDRKAGFFSSSALSAAARGIANLIRNGGRMRLLVSTRLSPRDVEAINKGYDLRLRLQEKLMEELECSEDLIERERLQALAWMVAHDMLDIRVAVPVNEDGDLQSIPDDELFHEKVGIFTDAEGNRLAFSGSNNESLRGWLKNRESFNAYWSWREGDADRIDAEAEEFEKLWNDESAITRVVDFPEAVRRELIEMAPGERPEHDPEDADIVDDQARQIAHEKWLFQFLRDAPTMPNGDLLAEAFSTVSLWPHQKKVSDQIVETFPEPYLLCDEVGLGKTIEAGISIKRLLLTGRVKRCLLLVPASLLTQWQEELVEKFSIATWQYTGSGFVDVHGNETPQDPDNPWNTHEVIIASSHLAKRRERAPVLLDADDWDLVVVDEAHHARRGQPTGDEYAPNLLLRLIQELRERTRGMLLLTATPMQLDPIEVWDLMHAAGLGGKWGALDGALFKQYFSQLQQFPEGADLQFLCEMLNDYLEHVGAWDQTAEKAVEASLGPIKLQALKDMGRAGSCDRDLLQWDTDQVGAAAQFFRAHTPLHHYVFRHTRDLLRNYAKQGLLDKNLPTRNPEDRFITFRSEKERELYDRIEDYIRDVYIAANQQNRSGVGFVMTIYRRRLTSSFHAIKCSLERRRAHLLGEDDGGRGGLTQEDIEEEDLSSDISQELEQADGLLAVEVAEELDYIDDFLRDIKLFGADTKLQHLVADLNEAFRTHQTVVVFTQYTDTLDYVRDELGKVYGTQVACYSGRGGELWDGSRWKTTTKEDIKALFAAGEAVKILLCTEAASEGLNLQTCSFLINYDMPWNPMRVEQRIGRIDRIGQEAEEVQVINYFYDDTVEAEIHRRLGQRIGVFRFVVGPLQPILARLPDLIRDAAFTVPAQREQRIAQIIGELDALYSELQQEAFNLEEGARVTAAEGDGHGEAPVRPTNVRELLLDSAFCGGRGAFDEVEPGVYEHALDGRSELITFSPNVYDRRPESVAYMAYGSPVFEAVLSMVPAPDESDVPVRILRIEAELDGSRLTRYHLATPEAPPIQSLSALATALATTDALHDPAAVDELRARLSADLKQELVARADAERNQQRRFLEGRLAALKRDAYAYLTALMAVDFTRAGLELDDDAEPSDLIDVGRLLSKRMVEKYVPIPALVSITGVTPQNLRITARSVIAFAGKKSESLAASWGSYLRRATSALTDFRELRDRLDSEHE